MSIVFDQANSVLVTDTKKNGLTISGGIWHHKGQTPDGASNEYKFDNGGTGIIGMVGISKKYKVYKGLSVSGDAKAGPFLAVNSTAASVKLGNSTYSAAPSGFALSGYGGVAEIGVAGIVKLGGVTASFGLHLNFLAAHTSTYVKDTNTNDMHILSLNYGGLSWSPFFRINWRR